MKRHTVVVCVCSALIILTAVIAYFPFSHKADEVRLVTNPKSNPITEHLDSSQSKNKILDRNDLESKFGRVEFIKSLQELNAMEPGEAFKRAFVSKFSAWIHWKPDDLPQALGLLASMEEVPAFVRCEALQNAFSWGGISPNITNFELVLGQTWLISTERESLLGTMFAHATNQQKLELGKNFQNRNDKILSKFLVDSDYIYALSQSDPENAPNIIRKGMLESGIIPRSSTYFKANLDDPIKYFDPKQPLEADFLKDYASTLIRKDLNNGLGWIDRNQEKLGTALVDKLIMGHLTYIAGWDLSAAEKWIEKLDGPERKDVAKQTLEHFKDGKLR